MGLREERDDGYLRFSWEEEMALGRNGGNGVGTEVDGERRLGKEK